MEHKEVSMGNDKSDPEFLFIGDSATEVATAKLRSSGIGYVQKRLESGPGNWREIASIARQQTIRGVVAKITASNCRDLLSGEEYTKEGTQLLKTLSTVNHIVFAHEALLTGESPDWIRDEATESFVAAGHDPANYEDPEKYYYFSSLTDDEKQSIRRLIEEHRINLVLYKRNSDIAVLATAYIEDNEKNLLFRVYVPSSRLWAEESGKLISLFREWVTKVKGHRVRQDGYTTPSGEIVEIYGDDDLSRSDLSVELSDFSKFLDLCSTDPESARVLLEKRNVSPSVVASMIERYTRDVRRVELDLKHSRETKFLEIRHRLETELIEAEPDIQTAIPVADNATPKASGSGLYETLGDPVTTRRENDSITIINQNFINKVEGVVAQELYGTVGYAPEARQLLELIQKYENQNAQDLNTAVHELEDNETKDKDHQKAKGSLKAFLFKVGDQIPTSLMSLLQRYIESKVGL